MTIKISITPKPCIKCSKPTCRYREIVRYYIPDDEFLPDDEVVEEIRICDDCDEHLYGDD